MKADLFIGLLRTASRVPLGALLSLITLSLAAVVFLSWCSTSFVVGQLEEVWVLEDPVVERSAGLGLSVRLARSGHSSAVL